MSMFLLPGLLTLAVFGRTVVAFPQDSIAANTTATITSIDTASLIAVETPEAKDQDIDPCIISFNPKSCGARERPELPTATGFDDTEVNSFITTSSSTQANLVVTSNIPTIIDIETNTAVRGGPATSLAVDRTEAERSNGQPNTAVQKDMTIASSIPEQSVGSHTGKTPPTITLSDSQPTPQNSLLSDVVSRLGYTGSNAQPTSTSLGTTNTLSDNSNPVIHSVPQSLEEGITPAPTMSLAPGPTPGATGNSITLGSAILTLTPGVSTTIGPNSDQTFIAIATNAAGSTLVTISSSGVAITATVSSTPTIMTLPKSGSEASTTHAVRTELSTGRLSTTTSRGLAVENKRSELGWWTSAILGFFGFAFGL